MELEGKIEKDRLHHAYVIEASKDEGFAALRELIGGFGISMRGNPDLHEYVFDALLMEHAELLRKEQSFRGAEGAKKIFLVAFNTMGHEAQNALLKTLEEPTEGTHFFFITKTRAHLLPTFLSRVQVIESKSQVTSHKSQAGGAGEEFLSASISERMEMIKPWLKAKDDDKPKAKEDARLLLESLERALYQKSFQGDSLETLTRSLSDVILAKRYLSDRAPSLKLLLEHLAVTVPRMVGEK